MPTRFKQFQTVTLLEDLPEHGLKAGARGTVLEELTNPHLAYEVEFADGHGRTLALLHLAPQKITDAT